ncbi:hypothetical protein [Chamaesiphon sp. VAR_69_metabat_338]|uniref:hypothetical protein n=1 Tax=Chamaesiphon sp. VAR_69_metabat_338 TaxID=2964704 RepID=UPI00286DE320|nr:hypothetical protein [Chamaesiphon sp. VAR_69_metabat_338]
MLRATLGNDDFPNRVSTFQLLTSSQFNSLVKNMLRLRLFSWGADVLAKPVFG